MTHTPAKRLLRAINILAGAILILLIGGLYWLVWRPLPQRSGMIEAPVTGAVSVKFDSLGVPHIHAGNIEDALFVQGYVTAQDRLWQMDSLRRYAAGELAEVIGPRALETDRELRRVRYRRIAEEAYTKLTPGDRAILAAYGAGVNQFIATHRDNLPVEFRLLQYQPRPWSAIDSLLVVLYMFRDLTTSWRNEIIKREMLADGDAEKVNYLFATRSGFEPGPGSNAWAVAGSHTASGKPVLSNDMHLEYSLPGVWHMAHLEAPGLNVSGVTVPGLPGVVVGHNEQIAWGITSLEFDAQDLYREKLDDRTGRYLYKGQVEQAKAERELIQIKGKPTVETQTWVTRHGPLFLAEGTERLVLRWTGGEPANVTYPLLDLDRAGNWQQFTEAVARWGGPGVNFVYADVAGNIGYHAAGRLPKRRGYAGDLPVDGSSGEFEWDGYIPFEEMPSVYNPPGGIIANANENPFPADYPYPVNGTFSSPHRVRQIRNLISAHNGWRAADMLKVQTDVYSSLNKYIAEQVVAAYDRHGGHNDMLDPAVALLRKWNGQMDKDDAAAFVVILVYQHLRATIAETASPSKGNLYEFNMAPGVVENVLRQHPAGWFQDYDSLLMRVLVDAVEEGRRIQGNNMARWKYGNYFAIEVNNPVIHEAMRRIPMFGKSMDIFEIAPTPMSGSSTTVRQMTRSLSPSMRMDAELGDWDKSLLNVQVGQSGQPLSGHYKDQWQAHYEGRSFPMQFKAVEAKSTLEFQPGRK